MIDLAGRKPDGGERPVNHQTENRKTDHVVSIPIFKSKEFIFQAFIRPPTLPCFRLRSVDMTGPGFHGKGLNQIFPEICI
ncbi:hypothetical protein [Komagataeibacter sp. FNDCF1]|uniref:hypothetical protein n=1 Tax=Komagataeibacter sp. FNDCF1 TaxID=2878681 RepID=UPI001E36BE9F|nr:hypothetical protein [Komagataeibacter sp. FNDCF1]MCE2564559.1 hypothetical protein [Komagataeibacter sp. FNDCF1]